MQNTTTQADVTTASGPTPRKRIQVSEKLYASLLDFLKSRTSAQSTS